MCRSVPPDIWGKFPNNPVKKGRKIFHRKLKRELIITEEDSIRFTLPMDHIQMSRTHHRLPKLGFHPSNLGLDQEQA